MLYFSLFYIIVIVFGLNGFVIMFDNHVCDILYMNIITKISDSDLSNLFCFYSNTHELLRECGAWGQTQRGLTGQPETLAGTEVNGHGLLPLSGG